MGNSPFDCSASNEASVSHTISWLFHQPPPASCSFFPPLFLKVRNPTVPLNCDKSGSTPTQLGPARASHQKTITDNPTPTYLTSIRTSNLSLHKTYKKGQSQYGTARKRGPTYPRRSGSSKRSIDGRCMSMGRRGCSSILCEHQAWNLTYYSQASCEGATNPRQRIISGRWNYSNYGQKSASLWLHMLIKRPKGCGHENRICEEMDGWCTGRSGGHQQRKWCVSWGYAGAVCRSQVLISTISMPLRRIQRSLFDHNRSFWALKLVSSQKIPSTRTCGNLDAQRSDPQCVTLLDA